MVYEGIEYHKAVIPTTPSLCKERVPPEADVVLDNNTHTASSGAKKSKYVCLATNTKVIDDAAALLDSEESICAGT